MCKKLICVIFFTLVLGIDEGQARDAVWERAAYWDVRYPTCFTSGRSLRDAFEFAGYKILDADELKTWMDGRGSNGYEEFSKKRAFPNERGLHRSGRNPDNPAIIF